MSDRHPESHALQEIHSIIGVSSAPQSVRATTPSEHASQDAHWRPSRSYQAMLLAAGFAMIFHVIGINSIYGIFQASRPGYPSCHTLTGESLWSSSQEFYTSDASNISDAKGRDALVSFVGTIGTGLTWSGSIFVNPLIARVKHLQLVMLSGVFIMSLGIFLASFSTKVGLQVTGLSQLTRSLTNVRIAAMAPIPYPSDSLRDRLFSILLSGALLDTDVL